MKLLARVGTWAWEVGELVLLLFAVCGSVPFLLLLVLIDRSISETKKEKM